jgi:hypothetical protein
MLNQQRQLQLLFNKVAVSSALLSKPQNFASQYSQKKLANGFSAT